jgi:hypothetical protein
VNVSSLEARQQEEVELVVLGAALLGGLLDEGGEVRLRHTRRMAAQKVLGSILRISFGRNLRGKT